MKNHLLKSKGHVSFSDACFGIVRVKPNSKRPLWGLSWRPTIYRFEEIRPFAVYGKDSPPKLVKS